MTKFVCCAAEDSCELERTVQDDLISERVPVVDSRILVSNIGKSARLPEALRQAMERAISADFSDIRIHVGPPAEQLNCAAFAHGSDIYFAPGNCRFDTPDGLQLLGHELVHVLQQRHGRLARQGVGLRVLYDRELESEAELVGSMAAAKCLQKKTILREGSELSWQPAGTDERRGVWNRTATGVIQKRFFIGKRGYSSHDGNLNELIQKVFPLAPTDNIGEVSQAVTRFDFQGRRFSTMVKFLSALNEAILLDLYEKGTPVPKYLHHFWAGGALSGAAFINLKKWNQKAEAAGWYQYILTDSLVSKAFNDSMLQIQFGVLHDIGAVIVDIAQIPFSSKPIYEQLRKSVVEQGIKAKLPYLSDLARYAQLLALGGLYVDVDVDPGTVDMREVLRTLNGIPQLGPCLRTTDSAKALGFDTLESMRTVAILELFSKNKLAIGNHFIAAPARNRVVAKANEIASKQVEEYQVTNGGIDFLKALANLEGLGVDVTPASLPAWIWDVVWITPESDHTVD